MADATILQAYKKLTESQAKRADIAGSFTKALDLSGRKARKEKEIEELNQRVAERLETLDGNINLNAVDDPKLKSALSKFGTEYKYSFSDKANQVGHLNDPTSMKHMKLVDEMNSINDQFRAVRAEMDYISKMQADYLTIVDEDGGFSVGQKNPEQVKALEEIFGGGGNYTVSVKDGHIVYNVGGKDYAAKDLKLPGRKAFDEAQALMASNAGLMSMGRALNAADEQLLRTQYDSMFKTESALRSILSDGDFGDIIPTSDIDIDEIGFEEAKTLFIDRLINANKASARRGIKTDEDSTGDLPSSLVAAKNQWQQAKASWKNNNRFSLKTVNNERLTFSPRPDKRWDVFITDDKGVAKLYQGGLSVMTLDEVESLFGYKFN